MENIISYNTEADEYRYNMYRFFILLFIPSSWFKNSNISAPDVSVYIQTSVYQLNICTQELTSWLSRASARCCTSDVKSCVPRITLLSEAKDAWTLCTVLITLNRSSRIKDLMGESLPDFSLGGDTLDWIRLAPWIIINMYLL